MQARNGDGKSTDGTKRHGTEKLSEWCESPLGCVVAMTNASAFRVFSWRKHFNAQRPTPNWPREESDREALLALEVGR